MEENFATRLKLFIESIDIPTTQFADMCGIPRPSFSQLLSGRNQKVSDVLIRKIHAAFPELSVMWLMFGEGTMLKSEDKKPRDFEAEAPESATEASNIPESPMNGQAATGYSNVSGLTQVQTTPNNSIYQQLEDNKKILELQMQIEKMQKNPRRVAQITVFYDDTTFETFVPSKYTDRKSTMS
ncbi:MAG: helix-turn-helix domain-containing protein [Muribaculaceae bacterium]|nr:helix-turn-helix domain-containing protein [Muribaculaceae bacterium]